MVSYYRFCRITNLLTLKWGLLKTRYYWEKKSLWAPCLQKHFNNSLPLFRLKMKNWWTHIFKLVQLFIQLIQSLRTRLPICFLKVDKKEDWLVHKIIRFFFYLLKFLAHLKSAWFWVESNWFYHLPIYIPFNDLNKD